jgi:hypothetical protein
MLKREIVAGEKSAHKLVLKKHECGERAKHMEYISAVMLSSWFRQEPYAKHVGKTRRSGGSDKRYVHYRNG